MLDKMKIISAPSRRLKPLKHSDYFGHFGISFFAQKLDFQEPRPVKPFYLLHT